MRLKKLIGPLLGLGLVASLVTVVGVASAATTRTETLESGGTLSLNDEVVSRNNRYKLVLQGDGNLVLLDNNSPIWATGTDKKGVDRAVMQGDGNFVLYAGNSDKWSSGTDHEDGSRLAVQDDGNVVIYNGDTWKWSRKDGKAGSAKTGGTPQAKSGYFSGTGTGTYSFADTNGYNTALNNAYGGGFTSNQCTRYGNAQSIKYSDNYYSVTVTVSCWKP